MKAWSGYDAANWSQNRGYVYFPTLDSRRDLDSYSLYELTRKSRWLYINSGFATRCIDGPAAMAGALTPVPLTRDKDWNQAALKSFNNNAGADLVFDVSGKFNFWSCQPMLSALRMLDGRCLGVLSESESKMARMMFYEGHQLTNGETDATDFGWQDGVRSTKQNRIISFRLQDGPSDENGASSYVTVNAPDAIYHCQFRRPGRTAGEPVLRHAINHLLDRAEIFGFLKLAGKNAAQIGYQITRATNEFAAGPTLPLRGLGANLRDDTLANGTKVKVEDAYRGGKGAEMDPGEEIKLLLDQRPHPNQLEFLEHLVRDIAWGIGCSPDILWNIAKLGGATARYVMADAQQVLIEPMQELLADQFCSRFWVYYVAKEMKAGRLMPCQDPEWWQHGWQPQQKLTVDITRDGKLYVDMHKSGMITLKRYHAALGQNWQQETDEYLDERAYIIQGVNARTIKLIGPDGQTVERPMTMDEAFPPQPGTSNVVERTTPADDPGSGGDPNAPANIPATGHVASSSTP